VGFQTLPCFFPPTFKVSRGEKRLSFSEQRSPSYTDCILWKDSTNMHLYNDGNYCCRGGIQLLAYQPVLEFMTSDHKPIRGAYEVTLNDQIQPRQQKQRSRLQLTQRSSSILEERNRRRTLGHPAKSKFHLFVSYVECNLDGIKSTTNSPPDPCLFFASVPCNFLRVPKK